MSRRLWIALFAIVVAVVPLRAQLVVVDPANLAQTILIAERTAQQYDQLRREFEIIQRMAEKLGSLERYRIPQKFRSLAIFQDPDKLMTKPKPKKKRPGRPEPAAAPADAGTRSRLDARIDALVPLPEDRLLYDDISGLAAPGLIPWTAHHYTRTVQGHKQLRTVEVASADALTSWDGFTAAAAEYGAPTATLWACLIREKDAPPGAPLPRGLVSTRPFADGFAALQAYRPRWHIEDDTYRELKEGWALEEQRWGRDSAASFTSQITAAKKEGTIAWYTADDLVLATQVSKSFEAKYGMTVQHPPRCGSKCATLGTDMS